MRKASLEIKRYAIFFPQFHQVRVNDLAWGHGFSDWALVAAANAFDYWRRRSPACGFYDLAKASDVQARFDAAAVARLDGFGLYHYHFSDGPELDAVERYLHKSQPPPGFQYFFIWANENWSRRWAGRNTEILKTVSSTPGRKQISDHVRYLRPYMESGSYTTIANKPMFVIYRPDVFKDPAATLALYRDEFARAGIYPSIGYFVKNVSDVRYSSVFDFGYIFEPRLFLNFFGIRKNRIAGQLFKKALRLVGDERAEMISEYTIRLLNGGARRYSFASFLAYFSSNDRKALLQSLKCPVQNVLTCGWNNAPRYRQRFTELEVPTPKQFSEMLELSLRDDGCSGMLPLLCNAWNEWSEGAAIEPCMYLGDGLLRSFVSNPVVPRDGHSLKGPDEHLSENDTYDITGSIVVYRNPVVQVQAAIKSFLNTQLKVRLYVIDNSPDDRLREVCADKRIVYIFNGRNLGFGAGHNIAMKASLREANYHVVLNPDVYFDGGVLERVFSFARARPDIGVIMPKVLNPDGSVQHLCRRLPAPSDLFIRRFLPRILKLLAEERLARYEFRDQDYNSVVSVPVLSGCFMMINCTALSQVGLFDERYFMYMEDVDLCRRIHRRFKTVYFPEMAIYHRYAKGSYRSVRLMIHHIVSALRYFRKWGWFSDTERVGINKKAIAI